MAPSCTQVLMVMDYASGGALVGQAQLSAEHHMPEPMAQYYFKQIVAGLAFLHENRVVGGERLGQGWGWAGRNTGGQGWSWAGGARSACSEGEGAWAVGVSGSQAVRCACCAARWWDRCTAT